MAVVVFAQIGAFLFAGTGMIRMQPGLFSFVVLFVWSLCVLAAGGICFYVVYPLSIIVYETTYYLERRLALVLAAGVFMTGLYFVPVSYGLVVDSLDFLVLLNDSLIGRIIIGGYYFTIFASLFTALLGGKDASESKFPSAI